MNICKHKPNQQERIYFLKSLKSRASLLFALFFLVPSTNVASSASASWVPLANQCNEVAARIVAEMGTPTQTVYRYCCYSNGKKKGDLASDEYVRNLLNLQRKFEGIGQNGRDAEGRSCISDDHYSQDYESLKSMQQNIIELQVFPWEKTHNVVHIGRNGKSLEFNIPVDYRTYDCDYLRTLIAIHAIKYIDRFIQVIGRKQPITRISTDRRLGAYSF
ncbi:MAG: hypothetical protein LBR89_02825, partial [Holosporales bacterium]|nr:hypothetical protein [Holosporales bacterium]